MTKIVDIIKIFFILKLYHDEYTYYKQDLRAHSDSNGELRVWSAMFYH